MLSYQKIDSNLKTKWVKALRSGDYKQCRATLYERMTQSYCCIGVGYEVLHPNKIFNQPRGQIQSPRIDTTEACLALGLKTESRNALVNLNDKNKESFPEIADWIEENL